MVTSIHSGLPKADQAGFLNEIKTGMSFESAGRCFHALNINTIGVTVYQAR